MTICFISEDFEPPKAGVGVHLQTLAGELTARGHQVLVITSRKPRQPRTSQGPQLAVHRNAAVRLSGFYHSVTSRRTIARLLAAHAVDLVHVHFLSVMAMQARRAAAELGLPTVYTYHMAEEIFTSHFTWVPPVQRFLTRQIIGFCNRFDLVTFPSGTLLEGARAKGLTATAEVLGNAIAFTGSGAAGAEASRDGRFTLLFVGRLSPEKNLAFLIRAFREVAAAHPSAALWLAGDGPIRQQLERLARSLGLADRITFLGHVPHANLARYYAEADAFVLPSFFETQGMVCVEAMQFGKPLLVSNGIVSARELVDEGVNGWLFDHTQEADLARVIDMLARDPEQRARMGASSRAKAASFALPAVVDAHLDVYERLRAARAGA